MGEERVEVRQGVLVKKRRIWHWPGLCRRVRRWLGGKGWQAANKGKEMGRAIKIAVYSETFLKIQSSLKCTQNIQRKIQKVYLCFSNKKSNHATLLFLAYTCNMLLNNTYGNSIDFFAHLSVRIDIFA